jgi:aminopeptidase N
VRALYAAFAQQNLIHFHARDGSGYQFLATRVAELDATNPQVAARLLTPLTRWQRFDERRRGLMTAALHGIHGRGGLSPDVYEVVTKSLPR